MEFTFTVNASLERSEGKFASRDELEEQLQEALEGADPGSVEGDAGGSYDVTDWSVGVEAAGGSKKSGAAKATYHRDEITRILALLNTNITTLRGERSNEVVDLLERRVDELAQALREAKVLA